MALESLCMNGITTFITVIYHLMCFSIVIRFLDLVCHLTFRSLVWFLLTSWSSLLIVSVCGKICSLVSHQVNLSCLWVSSYLFDDDAQWLLSFQIFLPAAKFYCLGNLSRSPLPSIMVLDMKSSTCRKNQKMSQCSIFVVSRGYFARFTCACTALYHLLSLLFP